jgi:tyrosyl-tRNA synthetase
MLTMDSVKLRLEREQPLTFLEFNYMILQGYDFVELNKRYDCTLQMGGSDQWGNIVQGVELGPARAGKGIVRPHLAAHHHLLRRQDGQDRERRRVAESQAPVGPTTIGSIGATPKTAMSGASCACSPTCRSAEIARLEQLQGAEINEAKKILATEATRLCHGDAAARESAGTAAAAFAGGAAQGLPTVTLNRAGKCRCSMPYRARHGRVQERGAAAHRSGRREAE